MDFIQNNFKHIIQSKTKSFNKVWLIIESRLLTESKKYLHKKPPSIVIFSKLIHQLPHFISIVKHLNVIRFVYIGLFTRNNYHNVRVSLHSLGLIVNNNERVCWKSPRWSCAKTNSNEHMNKIRWTIFFAFIYLCFFYLFE